MDIGTILYLCVAGVGLIYSIVSTVISVKTKKKAGENITISDIMNGLYDKMLGYIVKAEKAYSAYKGNANADTAGMKLNDVLNKLRSDCNSLNIAFDEEYWVKEIKNVIDVTKQVNIK